MKKQVYFFYRMTLFTIALSTCSAHLFAQSGNQKLTDTILHLDIAFWSAYNNCDTAHFKDFVSDDVEFYHDKEGFSTNAKAFIDGLSGGVCGNVNILRIRREAVKGTVNVYPMMDGDQIYGAIISGEHKFYLTKKGTAEFLSGIANFTQFWQLKNGVWKMTKIFSYNHHDPDYINTRKEIKLPVNQLDQLSGTYKGAVMGTVTVERANNTLILKMGGQTYTLYPQSQTLFFIKQRDALFQFIKNATGKPFKLLLKDHGAVVDELIFEK